jgi:hypothetical protein
MGRRLVVHGGEGGYVGNKLLESLFFQSRRVIYNRWALGEYNLNGLIS